MVTHFMEMKKDQISFKEKKERIQRRKENLAENTIKFRFKLEIHIFICFDCI
jgi:hypothetical protein